MNRDEPQTTSDHLTLGDTLMIVITMYHVCLQGTTDSDMSAKTTDDVSAAASARGR